MTGWCMPFKIWIHLGSLNLKLAVEYTESFRGTSLSPSCRFHWSNPFLLWNRFHPLLFFKKSSCIPSHLSENRYAWEISGSLLDRQNHCLSWRWKVTMLYVLRPQPSSIDSVWEFNIKAVGMSVLLLDQIFCYSVDLNSLRVLFLLLKELAFCLECVNI